MRVTTDSITVDTIVYVWDAHDPLESLGIDDDSGGGVFGSNAELVYEAPQTGEYLIAVADVWAEGIGA